MVTKPSAVAATPDATVTHEVEWQFVTGDLATVERQLQRPAVNWGFRITSLARQEIRDAYLDTDDWRVYRAGNTLRVRAQAEREAFRSIYHRAIGQRRQRILVAMRDAAA